MWAEGAGGLFSHGLPCATGPFCSRKTLEDPPPFAQPSLPGILILGHSLAPDSSQQPQLDTVLFGKKNCLYGAEPLGDLPFSRS